VWYEVKTLKCKKKAGVKDRDKNKKEPLFSRLFLFYKTFTSSASGFD
jgi:hypothetical protein